MLQSLHWLPIGQRIEYKLLLFCFRIISDQGPIIIMYIYHLTIMYIYHALINALSAHMIHINLNMIFYGLQTNSPSTFQIFFTCTMLPVIPPSPPPPPPPPFCKQPSVRIPSFRTKSSGQRSFFYRVPSTRN